MNDRRVKAEAVLVKLCALVAFGLVLIFLLSGCESPQVRFAAYYESREWQDTVTQQLYYDFRDDRDFDYAWPADVPLELREQLQTDAKLLYEKKDGK